MAINGAGLSHLISKSSLNTKWSTFDASFLMTSMYFFWRELITLNVWIEHINHNSVNIIPKIAIECISKESWVLTDFENSAEARSKPLAVRNIPILLNSILSSLSSLSLSSCALYSILLSIVISYEI